MLHVKVQGKATPVLVDLYAVKRRCVSTQSQPLQLHSPVTVLPVSFTRNFEWPQSRQKESLLSSRFEPLTELRRFYVKALPDVRYALKSHVQHTFTIHSPPGPQSVLNSW
jgi:hypothetical protein